MSGAVDAAGSRSVSKKETLFSARRDLPGMSELPGRVRRAFASHDAFESREEATFESTATAFEGRVAAAASDDGHVTFSVRTTVPLLDAVTEDAVASVVEDGWYETFERRVIDIGGIFRTDRDLEPTVTRRADTAVVETAFTDRNERRGVDDAAAVIDFVEGTFVQGIIPGYEYTEPVTDILSRARQAGGQ